MTVMRIDQPDMRDTLPHGFRLQGSLTIACPQVNRDGTYRPCTKWTVHDPSRTLALIRGPLQRDLMCPYLPRMFRGRHRQLGARRRSRLSTSFKRYPQPPFEGKSMTRRQLLPSLVLLSVAASLAAGGWVLFLRPVLVHVVESQRDVPVQVFGLGTVEARIASKVGFKISGVLTELLADQGDCVPKDGEVPRFSMTSWRRMTPITNASELHQQTLGQCGWSDRPNSATGHDFDTPTSLAKFRSSG